MKGIKILLRGSCSCRVIKEALRVGVSREAKNLIPLKPYLVAKNYPEKGEVLGHGGSRKLFETLALL